MTHRPYLRLRILWGLMLCLLSFGLPAQENGVHPPVYRFAVVPQYDARQLHTIWQPVLDALARKTGLHFELVGAPSINAFEAGFAEGLYDFAYMNPYHALVAHERQGYVPLVRDTGRSLRGIIVVRKDSSIESITQLAGKKVAFPSPNALGAALIPRAEFANLYHIEVSPWYVGNHDSVYLNVVLGRAAAGGGVASTLQEQTSQIRDSLRVIHQTRAIAPHPVMAHPRVDPEVREQVKQAFLVLGETESGRALLAPIPIQHIGEAVLEDYLALRALGLEAFYVTE